MQNAGTNLENSFTAQEYLEHHGSKINQESERLFVVEFIYPLLGSNIRYVEPQYPFLDSEGKSRRIDFAVVFNGKKIALEVNGETYHAEGIIPNEVFDDNLNRQNEILGAGFKLLRFSYSQLQSPIWRKRVSDALRRLFYNFLPELLPDVGIEPNALQSFALQSLDFYREQGWKKGIVVLPTGTGKTYLSAFDTLKVSGRVLFIVHRLDILAQAKESFEMVYPKEKLGLLTSEVKENVFDSKVLFASKDTLRNSQVLAGFKPDEFDYIIVDEVHHGQAPSYKVVLEYFEPNFFMLGLTATPDRLDRKDIFELFDYQKVFEFTLNDAIEEGYLVPYSYYGLQDNIDYSNIRYNGNKYNVADLDKKLIIKERNEQILKEYLSKGEGNKGIGFCSSINHAMAMAEFFTKNGVLSYAITSEAKDKGELIERFRNNEFNVAFTVDLFNEGVDFPDLRVIMFLRPTESKTIFFQQLGRGLRLCSGKNNVVVLDFIGNYKKANNIRKFLAKSTTEKRNPVTGRLEKIEYEYSPKCEVFFDAEVEILLENQDKQEREITKEDLVAAYYEVAEQLERKPTQGEINSMGEFKVSRYMNMFGSWVKFLREIGEYTEASYHFPQGTHLGHVLFIVKTLASGNTAGTHLDEAFIKFRGGLSADDRLGSFQRQTKYKLQATMEMGLVTDDRILKADEPYKAELTPKGIMLAQAIMPLLQTLNFDFKDKQSEIPSWEMEADPAIFNEEIQRFVKKSPEAWQMIASIFMEMHAVGLMLNYLYRVERKRVVSKNSIYTNFFKAPFISSYCDQNGIEVATEEGAKRRCPFLLNILESLGIIKQGRSDVEILAFLVCPQTMKLKSKESEGEISERMEMVMNSPQTISDEDVSLLKENFGKDFLSENYYLQNFTLIKNG